jgi:hypothetical protein
VEAYDQWYAEWNIEDLMSERMTLKDKKLPRTRASGVWRDCTLSMVILLTELGQLPDHQASQVLRSHHEINGPALVDGQVPLARILPTNLPLASSTLV